MTLETTQPVSSGDGRGNEVLLEAIGLKKYFPASKRFKELENNLFRALHQLRRRTKDGPHRAKSFTISKEIRERLVRQLEDDVRRLRTYIGPDFDGWGID